ncbi:hypothetical protein BY996DRAFT_6416381 [Phakopsora pachyrhizi]|nr:hypothetical protein BY996DRAFT_6423949 [Phakopsora pachyrhizi]KAI8451445.1 hypothetical protein BY996DRAFT_6416381 [Phakopsora pachyrhizi]
MSLRGSGSQANSLAGCFGGTCQVGASRVYSTSLRAYPEAELYLLFNIKISIFEDFGGEVLKVGLQDKPQGLFPEAEKIRPAGWFVGLLFAAHFYCAAAAAAQYEKGVSCNP